MIATLVIAKKSSRRLPRKNMLPFCGLPLCEWSIIQARCCRQADKAYLSTDSEEIARLGEKHNVEIIWRDYEQKIDDSAKVVYLHALNYIEKQHKLDVFLPLLPTAPLRLPSDLDRGLGIWFELARQGIEVIELPCSAPRKETFIYKLKKDKKGFDRFKYLYLDKFNNAGTEGVVCTITHPQRWKDYHEYKADIPTSDTILDKRYHVNRIIFPWSKVPPHYKTWNYCWPIESWQTPDIDYEGQFYFVEVLMKQFVLKGKGPEIYYDYWNAGKTVLPELSERNAANS